MSTAGEGCTKPVREGTLSRECVSAKGAPGPQNVREGLKGLPTTSLRNFCLVQRVPLSLIVLSAHGSLNVGNLLRAAHLSGVQRAWVVGRRRYDKRSSVGSEHYMDVRRVHEDYCTDYVKDDVRPDLKETLSEQEQRHPVDPTSFVELLRVERLCPVFLENAGAGRGVVTDTAFDDATPWKRWTAELPAEHELCLVVGNEVHGLPAELINAAAACGPSFVLTVRQLGAIPSHNVSVAGSLVMSDFRKFYMRDRLGRWVDF